MRRFHFPGKSDLGSRHLTSLLWSLLALFVLGPVLDPISDFPFPALLFALVVMAALRAIHLPRMALVGFSVIAALALIEETGLRKRLLQPEVLEVASILVPLTWAGLLAVAIFAVVRAIIRSDAVSEETIRGGVSVYLLMAAFFSLVFEALARWDPEAFSFDAGRSGVGSAFPYFSLTTLSTLGYGDLVPLTPIARQLATLEAVVGQLFLAIFMARLVSMQITRAPPSR
jgi:hypothetical protein